MSDVSDSPDEPRPTSLGARILAAIARIEDGRLIRAAFFALLAGTAGVLWVDFRDMAENQPLSANTPLNPILPGYDPTYPALEPGPGVTTDRALLDAPMTITLTAGGVLELVGTIDLGAAQRLRAELDARGEYVSSVKLDSPGGSVTDALDMGRAIRTLNLTTSVADGGFCASSCPLVFAGGAERVAGPNAAIGVHQVYVALRQGESVSGPKLAGRAMSDAQRTTATITRYLMDMGVEPELWLNALETPPDRLHYFSPGEMTRLKLATKIAA